MMSIDEAIKTRRSVFPGEYIDKEISRETIEELLELAISAPTHKKTQPWRFKVFQGESLMWLADFIAEDYKNTAKNYSAFKESKKRNSIISSGAIIAIILDRDVDETIPEWEEVAAVSCAVQNMWISAIAKGIGCYWSSPGAIDRIGDMIDLADNQKCIGLFYMGYHGELPEQVKGRKPVSEVAEWM